MTQFKDKTFEEDIADLRARIEQLQKLARETVLDMPKDSLFLEKLSKQYLKQGGSFIDISKPIVIKGQKETT